MARTPMDVQAHLPHRPPFLLVDRVLEREPGVRAVAEKLVTYAETYFQGHFPARPVLPGVLLLEMLAQTAGFLEAESLHGKSIFLAQVLDARFKSPAFPGDRLVLETTPEMAFGGLTRVRGSVTCEGRLVCTARLVLMKGPTPAADEGEGKPISTEVRA